MDVVDPAGQRLCALALLAGHEEACPGERPAPFGRVGDCALERLTAEGELYVDTWPDDDPPELRKANANR
jgi:hypothetical protein